jgi:phosphoglycolate phosphatase-like HAD superfamily hydrolase
VKKLILFDIDGTLIHTGGAGTTSLDKAFYSLFGIKDAFRDMSMAGKTDRQIMKQGLQSHNLPFKDGNVEALTESYLSNLKVEIQNPNRRFQPGIQEILRILRDQDYPLGLLTGNLEAGARIKLNPFGLNEYFPDGAFGSDHEDRDMLLPIAIRKFGERGFEFTPEQCIVIGDTPRDVQCARVHGAPSIAVATGPYSKESLLRTRADMVFDSLEDVERCMEFISNNI